MMMQPDPITFINTVLRNPDTGKPFDLLPAEIAFLEHAFELNEDGTAKYPELVYSAPKKSGKTGFAAILTLTATLLYGGSNPEAICAANDLEQSTSRVYSAIKRIVRASPALRDRARITNKEITFTDITATITAIASDFAGAAGGNPTISTFDELWGFSTEASRRLFDECVPPPTRKAAWRLVVTYAGFSSESVLLEELYKHGIAQEEIGTDLYSGNGQLTFWTHRPVAPWQTDAWLAQMRRSLRPNQYARMIENRWVTSESAFIDFGEWDACVDPDLQPVQSDHNLSVFIGVDASLKRDSTAIVAVTADGERVRLLAHRVFQPSPDQPLDFEATIEETIVDWCAKFSVQEIRFDPWQMASVAQRLIRRGAPMVEFPQTTSNLTDSSSNLYELIKAGNLQAYPDDAMRLSISQAVAVETPRGLRIAKEKQRHKIDVVVALAMASLAAVKQKPVPGWGILEHYRRMSEAATNGTTTPTLTLEHRHQAVTQIGTRRPANYVRVNIITDSSHIGGASGNMYQTEFDGEQRIAWMSSEDAKAVIGSPFADPRLRQANEDLLAGLGNVQPPRPGVRVSDMLQAAEDARPRSVFDRGGMVHDVLRQVGRMR
jgi:Phage Terminase